MPGGIERICTMKATYLAEVMNWDIIIVTSEQKGNKSYYPISDKVKVVDLDIPYSKLHSYGLLRRIILKLILQREHRAKLKELLFKEKANVVVSTLTHEVNFITTIKDGSKKILEFHFCKGHKRKMADAFGFNVLTRLAYYFQCWREEHVLIPKFDQFIVLTKEDQEKWKPLVPNVKCISNMLSFSGEAAMLESKKVIAVGRFDAQKRFDHLIQIWAKVSKIHPDWTLHIYGQGRDEKRLNKLISTLGCRSALLHSPSTEIKKFYMTSSIFVMTSSYEGLPMTLLEATSCGLPVVTYDFPSGPSDVIQDGVNGFIVEQGNIDKFVKRLSEIMTDIELRKYLGKNAYALSRRYSVDVIMRQWVELFENIIL